MKKSVCICLSVLLLASVLCTVWGALPLHALTEEINDPPQVIPAVQEWVGGKGRFTPSEGMKISLGSGEPLLSESDRDIICEFFEDVMGYPITFSRQPPSAGDIYFLRAEDTKLPSEGYLIDASSILKISARTGVGFFYAMITFLQSVVAEGSFPNGSVRDYPQYRVRSGMLDVARMYIPLEYVESVTKYFAWFKMNEIHLHVNDNGTGFSAFRLESDVEGLTSADGYYTKEEYRAYQKRAKAYYVDVVTEISTPAHAGCFADVVPELMLDATHLDVTNDETLTFVKNLLDEYIAGSDPVFASKKIHIGCDEYPDGYDEQMRAYTNALISHCASRNADVRFWGSFGGEGFNGETRVSGQAECNFWADSLSDPAVLLNMGYDIVNSYSAVLFTVPGGNNGFPDTLDVESLYASWFVNVLGNGDNAVINSNHNSLAGASFALWNDLSYLRGLSMYDVFERMKPSIAFVSEKTWSGDHTKDLAASDFQNRLNACSALPGAAFPSGIPVGEWNDESLSTYRWIGFPYLLEADVVWDKTGMESVLLSGTYGSLIVGADGRIGFRKTYGFLSADADPEGETQYDGQTFWFAFRLESGATSHLSLYGTAEETLLVVDQLYAFLPEPEVQNGYYQSESFCVPLETVGSENVSVSHLTVSGYPEDFIEQRLDVNLARKKTVTVDALDTSGERTMEKYAVDGNLNTKVFFRDEDEQSLLLDLGTVHTVNSVVLRFFEHVPAYDVSLSEDGEQFETIFETSDGSGGNRKDDILTFEPRKARYIRFRQLARYFHEGDKAYYGGSLSEVEVYGWDSSPYEALLKEAEAFPEDRTLAGETEKLREALGKEAIYAFEVDSLTETIEARVAFLKERQAQREAEESRMVERSVEEESRRVAESLEEEERERDRKRPINWLLFVLSSAAVAAVFLILFLRNRKEKS